LDLPDRSLAPCFTGFQLYNQHVKDRAALLGALGRGALAEDEVVGEVTEAGFGSWNPTQDLEVIVASEPKREMCAGVIHRRVVALASGRLFLQYDRRLRNAIRGQDPFRKRAKDAHVSGFSASSVKYTSFAMRLRALIS